MTLSKKIIGLVVASILTLGVGIGMAAENVTDSTTANQQSYFCGYGNSNRDSFDNNGSYGCPGWRR